jgi:hypothetical protein
MTELFIDLLGRWYLPRLETWLRYGSLFFFDDFPAEVNALIADIDSPRTGNQTLDLVLTFTTKRASIRRP